MNEYQFSQLKQQTGVMQGPMLTSLSEGIKQRQSPLRNSIEQLEKDLAYLFETYGKLRSMLEPITAPAPTPAEQDRQNPTTGTSEVVSTITDISNRMRNLQGAMARQIEGLEI